jgi:hypothetical protein
MTLSKTPSSVAGLSSTLDNDCFSFSDVCQQSQVIINVRSLHGQQIPRVSAKVFDPRRRAECVGGRNKSMHLNRLDQFGLRRDFDITFLRFEHAI